MSKTDETLREEVQQYARTYYSQHNSVPSVRDLAKKFKKKLTKGGFYKLFPNGMKQLCQEAEIQVPTERLKHTAEALTTRKTQSKVPVAEAEALPRLVLSESQTRRLFGLSHLENGKDPSMLVEEMLNRDTAARRLAEKPEAMAAISHLSKKQLDEGGK